MLDVLLLKSYAIQGSVANLEKEYTKDPLALNLFYKTGPLGSE